MKAEDVVELYNTYAKKNGWQQTKVITPKLRDALNKATKVLKESQDWEAVMLGWEAHDFFSGKSGAYKAKLVTMLYKSRYEEFYADGLELQEKSTGTDDFLAQLNNPDNYTSFKAPARGNNAD